MPIVLLLNRILLFKRRNPLRTLQATGSSGEFVAFVASGLPPGLILNPSDGNLSGIPSTAGSYVSENFVPYTLMAHKHRKLTHSRFWRVLRNHHRLPTIWGGNFIECGL